jgi:pyruvate,water dikinase
MAEYLVEIGIDSMSLNPDTVLKTTAQVLELEKRLGQAHRDAVEAREASSAVI